MPPNSTRRPPDSSGDFALLFTGGNIRSQNIKLPRRAKILKFRQD